MALIIFPLQVPTIHEYMLPFNVVQEETIVRAENCQALPKLNYAKLDG